MATKKKAAKPAAKKTVNVKKVAPAKKAAPKSAHSSGGSKTAKKAPAAKSIAKPAAKKVASVPAKKSPVLPTKKPAVSNTSKPAAKGHTAAAPFSKATTHTAKAQQPAPSAKPAAAPVIAKTAASVPPSPPPVAPRPEPKKPAAPAKPVKVVIPEIKTKTVRKYEPEFTKSVLDTPQEEQTGPTMRYSDAELGEFRELINRKLDAAKKELAYLQGLITRKDEMGGDNDDARYMTMEDGSMSMEREQLSQMASRQITFIDHLEKALMRIENKTYGICRVTGKLIDKARLRAVPHATLSIEAKQMMNK
ncbi:MAG TPA: TraR/DksA C4-type zinc finger protein [Puia sp.]|uniref:TraR/DksA family transcriptional regulator n=1 Tax=Puia sp. TaxID=2045100 RepID=UPI002C9B5B81|nr:TraR/DksA C4-type zinc finger protein [Puia sp.]HVU97537.1 TraR/DksA C4-type zinc finger protein [Puia sp.]